MSREQVPARWRRGRLAAALTGLAALVVVLTWFQPQALLFDRVVEEDFPVAVVNGSEAAPGAPVPTDVDPPNPDESEPGDAETVASPAAVSSGTFESRHRYTVTGRATVYEHPDGSRTVRLEDFASTNGPDLFVYLTSGDSADGDDVLGDDFVDVGMLRGNIGSQNYELPAGADLGRYDTVVIWCRRFARGFGAADLVPVT